MSAHPAFPAIVALWFAALLGIGSLVLPIALFENASQASGLAALLAAAQPPLGTTARIVIAFGGAALGVIIGLAVARRVIAAHAAGVPGRHAATSAHTASPAVGPAKRPISAHEELGEGGLDAEEEREEPLPGRRRRLTVTDETARAEFADQAPVPGQHSAAGEAAVPAAEAHPLDLAAFDMEEPAFDSSSEEPAALFEPPAADPGAAAEEAAMPGQALADVPAPELCDECSQTAPRALEELGMVDLVERFARALQHHRETDAPRPTGNDAATGAAVAFPPEAKFTVSPADRAPDDAVPQPAVPAAFRPFDFNLAGDDEDADEDELDTMPSLGLALPAAKPVPTPALQPVGASGSVGVEPEEFDESGHESEQEYPSLLAMKSPFGLPREPIRIDDEEQMFQPVAVFPGNSPRDASAAAGASGGGVARPSVTVDTERALREALEKLQRMSGAA